MSQKEKKGKQSARNPEDEVQNKSSRIIKRHPSRLLGISQDVATLSTTLSNHPARSKIPVIPDVERIRSNTRTTPGTQEGAGRDVVTPSNRSKIPVTSDVERIRPNTRSNTPGSKTDVAPPAEDLPTGNDEELKQQIYDLRIQNHQLERQNRKFANQIKTLKANITSLKDENEMLMSINEAFGQENEQLNDEIKQFRSFRIPRSLQSTQSSSQPRSSDEDLADGEDESSFHPVKRKRHKAKGKRIARNDDGEECDNEEAQ
ncbi:14788_t:CDS:2, partial [Rhizophagus irregularis]